MRLHYKGPKNEISVPVFEDGVFVDPTGVLTDEQLEELQEGKRIAFEVDGAKFEAWIS